MGENELAELERLLSFAAPGPWSAFRTDVMRDLCACVECHARNPHDALLMAAAVNSLATLIAAVRERDAVIAAVRELAEQWDQVDYGVGRYHEDSAFRDGRELEAGKCADDLRTALAVLPGIEQEEGKA